MREVKKILGFVWMLMAPAIICFLMYEAYVKIGIAKPNEKANTILQWVIILTIFMPISISEYVTLVKYFCAWH
jgi:magnesium-transporting ATPase (P-type)